jgi:cell pole-organizing protein PopZ
MAETSMGPASSAQREPSMEEILASIRRIIEDSDSARGPVVHDETAPAERPDGSVIEVDAFRAELRGKAGQPEPAESRREADVVVRPPVAKVPPVPQPAPRRAAPVEQPVAEPSLDAGFDRAFEPVRENRAAAEARRASAPAPSAPASSAPVQAAPTAEAGRPAIISERTGRQVAAAFGELSDAFAASRRRSFDEIAEEMLRPMLQDWLDNNLPTLVERLVREEIERVARGA